MPLTAPSRKAVHALIRAGNTQTAAHQRCQHSTAQPGSAPLPISAQLILHWQGLSPSSAKVLLQPQKAQLLPPNKVQYQATVAHLANASCNSERGQTSTMPHLTHGDHKVNSINNPGIMKIREQSTTSTRCIKLQPITHQESYKL